MKQICLARALFLIGICIIYQLFVVRGGAAWKIELFFSSLSLIPFFSKKIHQMSFAGKKRVRAICWGVGLLFANGTGEGQEEHLRGNRVACTSSHVKQIWAQLSCSPFP